MLSTAGLALEQAPPIDLPARFFLTAPLFAAAAGLLLAWEGEDLLASRWTPAALAATHLLAIGCLGQIMCGALLQMLPVLAGSPVPAVRPVAVAVHLLLSSGAAALAWGLLGGGKAMLALGGLGSALGFLVFLGPVAFALVRARGVPDTVRALRLAGGALLLAVLLGVTLIAGLLGWARLPQFVHLVDAHAALGLMGWVGLLIVAVAYQVVPMFYVTPEYPRRLRRALAPVLGALILAGALAGGLQGGGTGMVLLAMAAAGFVLFAAVTLWLMRRRERRGIDAALLHWWGAMGSLCAGAVGWALQAPPPMTGILLLVGAGVGLTTGMLLKIVPFLSWFHLQHIQVASGRFDRRIPHMRGFLPERLARLHLFAHFMALALLVAAVFVPMLAPVGGMALALSALLLTGLLLHNARTYRHLAGAIRGGS